MSQLNGSTSGKGSATVAILLLIGSVGWTPQGTVAQEPLVIAHRGASAYAPEHTFASWDRALELGADFIELDLQMTRDGELVVLHDEELDRTARGPAQECTGLVRERTLQQIQRCDVGGWFNAQHPDRARDEFVGLAIPTLRQVLERYGLGTRYYIETKNPEAAPGMEDELLRLLAQHGLLTELETNRIIIQSFYAASLLRIRALHPGLSLVQLVPDGETSASIRQSLEQARAYATGIGPEQHDVDEPLVAAAHEVGLWVHPYTVNTAESMRRLLDLGVDGMFTDRPDLLRRVLEDR